MSQQIINIPINWDDDAIKMCIEQGVIAEVKNEIKKQAFDNLGIGNYYHSHHFDGIVKECVKEVVVENKEYILEEVIARVTRSINSSKDGREIKKKLLEEGE